MKHKKVILFILLITSLPLFSIAQVSLAYDKTIKLYFVAELIPNLESKVSMQERMKIQQAHMANIKDLVEKKKLVMAGPFPQGGGLFFLSVKTQAEAEEVMKADPSITSGLNTFSVRPWFTEKGLFTLDN
jgi:uncharacterized protein YciI